MNEELPTQHATVEVTEHEVLELLKLAAQCFSIWSPTNALAAVVLLETLEATAQINLLHQ